MPETFNTPNPQYTSTFPTSTSGSLSNINTKNQASGSLSNVRNQASGSLSNVRNRASGSLNKAKDQLERIKGKQNINDPFKNLSDPKAFLKQQNLSISKNQVITVLLPIVSQFIKVEFIAKLIIKKLEKQTREQVKNKGTLTVQDGTFTFTPSDNNNYQVFKDNFDKKVNNLKTTVKKLQQLVTILNNIIKVTNIALSIIQVLIKMKLSKLNSQLISISTDLASPSPSKSSGPALIATINDILKLQKYDKKVEEYKKGIAIAKSILIICNNALTDLKIQLDTLKFIITDSPNNNITSPLSNSVSSIQLASPDSEDYTDAFGKSYILKLVTLPNGAKQYQALDSYSKMKITQTAPSRIKTEQQLLEEIKQILG